MWSILFLTLFRDPFPVFKNRLDFFEHLFYNIVTMEALISKNNCIDMICQHNADGTIIPLKIRMLDSDGAYQEYKVHAYKDLTYKGVPLDQMDPVRVHTAGIYPFECKIDSFGYRKTIRIFDNSYDHTWKLASRQ